MSTYHRMPALVEREAEIVEALAEGGSMPVAGIARVLLGTGVNEKVPRSWSARVTQSLRVLERAGIVTREEHGVVKRWRLVK